MVLNTKIYPQRKKLPHELPSWVVQGVRHFITINCREREKNTLCREAVAGCLLRSGESYEALGHWCLWLMLIMPDHLHLIVTIDLARGIRSTIAAWKGYQAKKLGVDWQAGFFEHRLRNDNEYAEKAHYIRMNPVRRGLVSSAGEWPHVIDRSNIGLSEDGSAGTPRPTEEY